jgi:DNA polymerase-3 subunit gamma/tau
LGDLPTSDAATVIALARKYRPRTFAEVAVQTHVSQTLKGAITRDRVAHGYLFCGPRGTGKTTLARVLAMALNCPQRTPDGEPCGTCVSCEAIWTGQASMDVVEIDAATNRGVDDAKTLRGRVLFSTSEDDRFKVYIVDEAHMLTREAWNALLKVLEEPPPRVVFAFATTEPQKIAQAASPVLSRVQRFDLKRMGAADILDRLTFVARAEGLPADPDALTMVARASEGGMRDALSILDQVIALSGGTVTVEAVRSALGLVPEEEYLAVLDLIADRRAGDVFRLVGDLVDRGVDLVVFLAGLTRMLRGQLAAVLGSRPTQVTAATAQALEARRDRFTAGDTLLMLDVLVRVEPEFRKSGQQRRHLETALLRFATRDPSPSLEAALRALAVPVPATT